ncbi:hypothetical protein BJY01DRAFT_241030 [Aspergillus pseudoustus]|uniref:NmrA-like domain-containing protein n=1 Tax=Aspergillus pseudoustus TaxID=1810923 RepID=A0ABR4IL10_9EURO
MVNVAVAGGTGGVGRTIVEQLLLSGSKHKTFILGRKAPAEALPGDLEFLVTDYGDVNGLTKLLEDFDIDTIISTLNMEIEAGSQAQLNLIAAADKSRTTRRIIPSEFVTSIDENSDPNSGLSAGGWIPNTLALKQSSLEYVRISNGMFFDYWTIPYIQSHLKPFNWGIDMANKKAVIPGTGDDKFTVTYSRDLAKVIVRFVDEKDKWPERCFVSGSDISFNALLAIAEEIRGQKFDVLYDPLDKLVKGDATLLWRPEEIPEEEMKALMSAHSQMLISGAWRLPLEGRVEAIFPEIRLRTVKEVLSEAWMGK